MEKLSTSRGINEQQQTFRNEDIRLRSHCGYVDGFKNEQPQDNYGWAAAK